MILAMFSYKLCIECMLCFDFQTFFRNNKNPNLINIIPVVETPVQLVPTPVQPLQRTVSSPLNASLDEIAAKLIPQQQLSKPVDNKELPDEEQEGRKTKI